MSNNIQPIFIMPEGTQRTTGKTAQHANILAAKAVAETVRTTLGPKGMDKMIVDSLGDVIVTNDGVTILKEINIEHPAAKMIVEVAKTQEDEVGDGTTTAVILAGELLKNAESLIDKDIHPTVLVKGYRRAATKAYEILKNMAEPVTEKDDSTLLKIAMTAMIGKGAESSKETLAKLAVSAVKKVIEVGEEISFDPETVKIQKHIGGSIEDSELVSGIVLDKERVHSGMPKLVKNAKIALIDSSIEIKGPETDAKIQITDPSQLQAFIDQEEKSLKEMVDVIAKAGANVVFCQRGVDDIAQHYFSKHGIYVARRVKKSDMEALSKATGANIVTTIRNITKEDLGNAGMVHEEHVGDDGFTFVRDCKNPKSVTIILKGGTEHVVDEIKRAVEDAIGDLVAAIKGKAVVAGAGAPEIELSKELRKFAESLSGREQLAVMAFADAMEIVPRTLAENSGLDPIDVITELKAAHDKKQKWAGIDVFKGKIVDSWKKGVIEPLKIKTQAISSASEVAEMILRIDDVIAGGRAQPDPNQGMGGGGMPPMM